MSRLSWGFLLVLFALGSVGCPETLVKDPLYCATDWDCKSPATPFCDRDGIAGSIRNECKPYTPAPTEEFDTNALPEPKPERVVIRGNGGVAFDLSRPVTGTIEIEIHAKHDDVPRTIVAASGSALDVAERADGVRGENARYIIDTTRLADGAHDLVLGIFDGYGHEAQETVAFTVDNHAPALTVTVPEQVAGAMFRVRGNVADTVGVDEVRFVVDGVPDVVVDRPSDPFVADLAIPCGRKIEIVAIATDRAGHRSAPIHRFVDCGDENPAIVLLTSSFLQENGATVTRNGARLSYAFSGSADRQTIGEATTFPIVVKKYLTRLDWLESVRPNIPIFRFVAVDDGTIEKVEYRTFAGGTASKAWTELEAQPDGRYQLPIAYQFFGQVLATSAEHVVEIRATDDANHETTRTFSFTRELLSPPVYVSGCRDLNTLSFDNLGTHFGTGTDVPITEAKIDYLLDLPEHSGAPTGAASIGVATPDASAKINELTVHSFVPRAKLTTWDTVADASSWGSCTAYEARELWNNASVCVTSANQMGQYGDRFVSGLEHTASTDPILARLYVAHVESVSAGVTAAGNAEVAPTAGNFEIRPDSTHAVTLRLSQPRITIDGSTYSWRNTFASSADYVISAGTEGRYRLPRPYGHVDGEEHDKVLSGFPIVTTYKERPFETRMFVTKFEVTMPNTTFTARHATIADMVVPVEATGCNLGYTKEFAQ